MSGKPAEAARPVQSAAQTPEGGTPIVGDDPSYLKDPVLDATVRMVVELAAQVWVDRERLLTIEALLNARGVISREAIEAFQPDVAQQKQFKTARDQFIEDIFKELRRIPVSTSPL